MPIICNVPLPNEELRDDTSALFDIYGNRTTQRGERFSGIHNIHDDQGNIVQVRHPISQPQLWSRRALHIGKLHLVKL